MFWNRSPEKKLQKQYEALTKEAYRLSTIDRTKSDEKYAEADAVLKEIDKLKNKS